MYGEYCIRVLHCIQLYTICMQEDRMFRSFVNIQNTQCADSVFRCLTKTAPEVFHNVSKKIYPQKVVGSTDAI